MFIVGHAGSSLPRGLFSSCAEWGLLCFPAEGFSSPKPCPLSLQSAGSGACTLNSCDSGLSSVEVCGVFPDQASEPGPFTAEPPGKPWPHLCRRCWRNPSSPARQPRVTQLAPSPLLLEETSPEDRELLCAGPEGTPGKAGVQPSLLHRHSVLPGDTMRSAPSALRDLLETQGGFLGMVATQELGTLAPQR